MKMSIPTILCLILFPLLNIFSTPTKQKKTDLPTTEKLCNRISEIKRLPFKSDKSDDPVHDALIDAGEDAIPCLIQKLRDTTRMVDPRQAPTYDDVRVGDVAYFILVQVAKLEFTSMLPLQVQKDFDQQGVYAYFRYVKHPKNRKQLHAALQNWYQQKQESKRE